MFVHAQSLGILASSVKTNLPRFQRHHPYVPENASAALTILADNLERLRAKHLSLNTQSAIGREAKVDQKTVGRILNKAHEPQINIVAKLAKAFGLEPWQMLVPGLDPQRPPVLMSAEEREHYEKLREAITKQADHALTVRNRLKQNLGAPIQETYDDSEVRKKAKGE